MELWSELIAKAAEVGISVTEEQARRLQKYWDLLLEWNERINLTAITDPHQAVVKHFVDSLLLLKAVKPIPGAKFLDVGTGAGFPGVPVKIMRPDLHLTLLDGLNKRLVFLKEVSEKLGFQVELVHRRAEEAGTLREMREAFDLVTARAVAPMNPLCEYCIPLVRKDGLFVAMKGPGLDAELEEAERAITVLGCQVERVEKMYLPDEERSERNIAVLRKIQRTPKEYPRHGNKIKKSPIF